MRSTYPIQNLAAGASWPEAAGGRDLAPFRWVLVENRGQAAVAVDVRAPAANDSARTQRIVNPGERRVFNIGRISDSSDHPSLGFANELHLTNTGNVATTLWVETDSDPIVDLSAGGESQVQLVDQAGAAVGVAGNELQVGDQSSFFVETTAALGASASFVGPWRDAQLFNWAGAYAVADQAFTLAIDEADAAVPAVINQVQTQASAAAPAINSPGGQSARVAPQKTVLRFVRVRVVNGATAQTRLNCQSSLSPLN